MRKAREDRQEGLEDPLEFILVPQRIMRLTNAAFAEESARLGGRGWWRRVLNLRGGGSARLAHGVGAMHDGGCVVCVCVCKKETIDLAMGLSELEEVSPGLLEKNEQE